MKEREGELLVWEWIERAPWDTPGSYVQILIESEGTQIGVCFDGFTARSRGCLATMAEDARRNPRAWRRIL